MMYEGLIADRHDLYDGFTGQRTFVTVGLLLWKISRTVRRNFD